MAEAPIIDHASIESWLSIPRYKRYLEVADGDDSAALDLYLWNIGLHKLYCVMSPFSRLLLGIHTIVRLKKTSMAKSTGCLTCPHH